MTVPRQFGDATLYHGDCAQVMAQLPAESVTLLWTDPPYGHSNGVGDFLSRRADILGDGCESKVEPIANDGADDMRTVVDAMLVQACRVLRSDCCCCCGGGGPSPSFAWLAQRMDESGLSFFHSVIWDKINPGVGWRYRRQHEMVMVAHRRGGKLAWNDTSPAIPNILRVSKPRGSAHPNEKPLRLVARFIEAHTQPGDIVLDPFMGSGTTGVAALTLGRRFIGIELDQKHFDTACDRIAAAAADSRQSFFPPEVAA